MDSDFFLTISWIPYLPDLFCVVLKFILFPALTPLENEHLESDSSDQNSPACDWHEEFSKGSGE